MANTVGRPKGIRPGNNPLDIVRRRSAVPVKQAVENRIPGEGVVGEEAPKHERWGY